MKCNTAANRKRFLEIYQETGNISAASLRTGIDRGTHYKWLGADPDYAAAFEEANQTATDLLIEEARRRACDGWTESVIYQGKQCYAKEWNSETDQFELTQTPLAIRKYSDNLLMFLIKARRPEFRDSWKGELEYKGPVSHGAPDFSVLSDEQFEQLRTISALVHGNGTNGHHAVAGTRRDRGGHGPKGTD